MVLARLTCAEMQGKLWNGGAYVKDVKQLKFTDSICESEREYVDDAILGLIAGTFTILIISPSFSNSECCEFNLTFEFFIS